MSHDDGTGLESATAGPGRRRDGSRDAAILDAALSLLAEVGYDGLTMELVAGRAKAGLGTVYRRWASKADMVLDAVHRLKAGQVDLGALPDTGSLRGDLLALFRPATVEATERDLRILNGLGTLLARHPDLAGSGSATLSRSWIEANRRLIRRAIDRGQIDGGVPVDTLATVLPALCAHRTLVQHLAVDQAFLAAMIDDLLMPALMTAHPGRTTHGA